MNSIAGRLERQSNRLLLFLVTLLLAAPAPSTAQTFTKGQENTFVQAFPTGRFYLDGALYGKDEKQLSNGTQIRMARLGIRGVLDDTWLFELEIDVADEDLDIKDLWVSRQVGSGYWMQIGNFKEPFSLEELTSSRFLTFMERSLPNAFTPGRSAGIGFTAPRERIWLSGGVFGQEVDEVGESELGDSEGWGVSGRAVGRWRSVSDTTRLVHVGMSATRRTPDAREGGEGRVRFRSYPESRIEKTRWLNTGHIRGTDHFSVLGFEGVASWGPFSIQGEHIRANVTSLDDADPVAGFSGSYAQASWFPTGESRRYDPTTAEFAEVIPNGERGALELAIRVSTLDLNDEGAGVEGGESTQWTAGVNWYLSQFVRLSLNHLWVDNGPLADGDGDFTGDDDFRVLQARFQMWF